MSIRDIVYSKVTEIAEQQHKTLTALNDETLLLQSGLDSLCVAILIAGLEDDLGVDPFSAEDEVEIPTTLGDLVRLYERAVATA
jgi:acyl carrier protein